MMEHETNTFSPVPTPYERFGRGGFGVPTGPEVVERFAGTGTGIGAFLDVAAEHGMEIVSPVAANAAPSGQGRGRGLRPDDRRHLCRRRGRLRRLLPRPPRGHGGRDHRRWGGHPPATDPRDRPRAPHRRQPRPPRQPDRGHDRQLHRRRRLQDLSPPRHVHRRPPRRRAPGPDPRRRDRSGHGVGESPDPGPDPPHGPRGRADGAADRAGPAAGGRGAAGRIGVRRVPPGRHLARRPVDPHHRRW